MEKGRLEAFSDGVIAIILTIMVLEIKVPRSGNLAALRPLIPIFFSYLMSFVFIGIYWNNHHHLFQVVQKVSGRILWANLHLLFWLSLTPVVTGWMGEHPSYPWPVALYGVILLLSGMAYFILTKVLIAEHGNTSLIATAVGRDYKGFASLIIYCLAIPFAFYSTSLALALYVFVALLWLIPDKRIEGLISSK